MTIECKLYTIIVAGNGGYNCHFQREALQSSVELSPIMLFITSPMIQSNPIRSNPIHLYFRHEPVELDLVNHSHLNNEQNILNRLKKPVGTSSDNGIGYVQCENVKKRKSSEISHYNSQVTLMLYMNYAEHLQRSSAYRACHLGKKCARPW